MKFLSFTVALLFTRVVFAANVEVNIKGMTCGMCVSAITKELTATNKVDKIKVSLEEKKAYFSEKKENNISDDEIKKAIKKAGYQAIKITRN